jgi:hypothetical protein
MRPSNPISSARFAISRSTLHGTGLPSPSAPTPIGSDIASFIPFFKVILSPLSNAATVQDGRTSVPPVFADATNCNISGARCQKGPAASEFGRHLDRLTRAVLRRIVRARA